MRPRLSKLPPRRQLLVLDPPCCPVGRPYCSATSLHDFQCDQGKGKLWAVMSALPRCLVVQPLGTPGNRCECSEHPCPPVSLKVMQQHGRTVISRMNWDFFLLHKLLGHLNKSLTEAVAYLGNLATKVHNFFDTSIGQILNQSIQIINALINIFIFCTTLPLRSSGWYA